MKTRQVTVQYNSLLGLVLLLAFKYDK